MTLLSALVQLLYDGAGPGGFSLHDVGKAGTERLGHSSKWYSRTGAKIKRNLFALQEEKTGLPQEQNVGSKITKR